MKVYLIKTYIFIHFLCNVDICLGIGSFAGRTTEASDLSNESEILYEEAEDDAVAKFYKQHMVKSKAPGHSTAHKVDSYLAEATTRSFRQGQQRKQVRREQKEDIRYYDQTTAAYGVVQIILVIAILIASTLQMIHQREHDAELRRIKLENEKKSSVK